MKKSILFFAISFILTAMSSTLLSQEKGINYQAVIRDAEGILITNENVNLTFEFYHNDDEDFTYSELHQIATDEFGMVNLILQIGRAHV